MNSGPGLVVEKIIRQRIHDSLYWKQHCFALNAATLCDRAAELTSVGGMVANQRPTPFISLLYKLILIHPDREIIEEYLAQPHFKYLTALAAMYVRLVYKPRDVYLMLEPLLDDFRKLRWQTHNTVELWHMDEFADSLLTQGRVLDLTLPRLPPRINLEDAGMPVRESALSDSDD